MAKEVYYFSHDSNALTDTKILNMRADYGLEGYGLYWAIIEMFRNEENYKLVLSNKTYKAIKVLTSTTIDVEKYVDDCIKEYGLFEQEDKYFFSKSLLGRMQEYEKKKKINKENGRLGGRPKKERQNETEKEPNGFEKKTEIKPNGFEKETEEKPNPNPKKPKERKEKEKKEKEIKGNENKINEKKEDERNRIIEIYNSVCRNLPQAQKLTDKRKKNIDKFLKEFSIEQFQEICNIANSSNFLTGNNDREWKADFDFIMRTDKATAILEGKYNTFSKGGFNDFKDLMEEARKKDELSGNNTSNNSFGW